MWRAVAAVAARPSGATTTTAAAAAATRAAATTAATTTAALPPPSPLAAAAAVARVLMLAHGRRAALPIALQYRAAAIATTTTTTTTAAAGLRAFSSSSSLASSLDPQSAPAATNASPTPPTDRPHGDTYDIRITLRAYDLRFLEEAACAVQDLVLINLAPKDARSLLGTASDGAARSALRDGSAFAFPCLGAATPPKQRTLYSLIRSPHKYKTSFEQFERVAHRRVVSASTPDHDEAQWLLACLRFYQFTGVEVEVAVTSAPTYLLPGPFADAAAAGGGGGGGGGGVFAAHRARFAALFDGAAAAAGGGARAAGSAEGRGAEQEQQQREALAAGLRGLREALGSPSPAAPASSSSSSSSSSSPQHPLLAAVDRVLGGLDVDALVREELERRRAGRADAELPPSLLSIPPDLLERRPEAAAAPAAAAASKAGEPAADGSGGGGASAAPSSPPPPSPTAADWLYATMSGAAKGGAASPQQAEAAALSVDERDALAAAREQYARFFAGLQVALLRGWAARAARA
jgi:small subunit ribosomal protein S10